MYINLEGIPLQQLSKPTPDYMDLLLSDVCYTILRQEGIHEKLSNDQWEAQAAVLAGELRVTIIEFISKWNG